MTALAPITAPHLPRVPTWQEADAAADAWGFNCGPAALCAVTGRAPDAVRQALGVHWPGYTNPTCMSAALAFLDHRKREVHRGDAPLMRALLPTLPVLWLSRIQWGGRWCEPGVPMGARYRKTHWIAESVDEAGLPIVYDVNAVSQTTNGWLTRDEWAADLVPWLLKAAVPRADGRWWPTHVWEVLP